jgi:hypothetical protein
MNRELTHKRKEAKTQVGMTKSKHADLTPSIANHGPQNVTGKIKILAP